VNIENVHIFASILYEQLVNPKSQCHKTGKYTSVIENAMKEAFSFEDISPDWYLGEKEFYGTFGNKDEVRKNCFVVIKARTMQHAREQMFGVYNNKWAFVYPTAEEAGVDKYKLMKINLGE